MNCVDTLLKNGVKPSSIRTAMKIKRCDEMLEVSGVGRTKLEKFGKEFLEEIAKFR